MIHLQPNHHQYAQFNIKIMGLRRVPVTTTEGFERLLAKGHKERSTGVTSANAHSSRSHAVIRFDVVVKGTQSKPGEFTHTLTPLSVRDDVVTGARAQIENYFFTTKCMFLYFSFCFLSFFCLIAFCFVFCNNSPITSLVSTHPYIYPRGARSADPCGLGGQRARRRHVEHGQQDSSRGR